MTSAAECATRHRGTLSRSCLRDHAAAWARTQGYRRPVDDALIEEWARVRNGVIPGPVRMVHGGRAGQHGEWPTLAYRRLLSAIRLREQGVVGASEIRLRMHYAGQRAVDGHSASDLARAYEAVLRGAHKEIPIRNGGRIRSTPPLRLRKEVAKAVGALRSGTLVAPAWVSRTSLEKLRGFPDLEEVCLAALDLLYRGPVRPVLERLKKAATLLPPGVLGHPGEIVDATIGSAGALAVGDEMNPVVDVLDRAGAEDVQLADICLAWLPKLLQWLEDGG